MKDEIIKKISKKLKHDGNVIWNIRNIEKQQRKKLSKIFLYVLPVIQHKYENTFCIVLFFLCYNLYVMYDYSMKIGENN